MLINIRNPLKLRDFLKYTQNYKKLFIHIFMDNNFF